MEIQIIILIILIGLSALFSGVETALMSVSMMKVKSLLKQKKKGAEALFRVKNNPHKLLITVLIGNNLVNIGAASLATVIFTEMFGSNGIGIATGVMTFLILVFGEITPKTFATQNAERMSLKVARPIEILSKILWPLVKFFELISRAMSKRLGSKKEKDLSEEELKTIVTMGKEEGILSREAAEMMHNMIEFEDTRVTEVMTRKSEIEMLDGDSKLKEVLDFVVKSPFSRYPIYEKNKDNIIGVVDIDDVLRFVKNKRVDVKVKTLSKPVPFVPESKEIDDLLTELEGKDVPLAIVVDEFGNVSGMVTLDDILEEIVGEIFDKSKRRSIHIKKINEKTTRIDAQASVQEVNKILSLGIDTGHFDTIAGYIEHKLQRIPKKGERIKLKNAILEIDKVSKQKIISVKVIRN
ncbi:MAG: hemolysin family protein [Candidatus Aenigmatarchaeota archaeon]